ARVQRPAPAEARIYQSGTHRREHRQGGATQADRQAGCGQRIQLGGQTLRWRSRLPSDPPFANTRLIYILHYKLSGVLLKEDSQYRLDHDFAFPNRAGAIFRFSLNLELDPVWKPVGELQTHYNAGPLAPGTSFVLTIPLRNAGTVSPVAIDSSRSPEVLIVTAAIVVIFALIVLSFLFRERQLGRFAAIHTAMIDKTWIEENIVAHPAE